MSNNSLLSLQNISKTYGGVRAVHDVSMIVKPGEIHALVGANGAGKSTLIKILSGATTPDSGSIIFDGVSYQAMTPKFSKSLGIEVIYQELNLIPSLTVAENIFLGNREQPGRLFNANALEMKADSLLKIFGLDIRANMLVKDLSVAYMQIVEIAKALSQRLRLIVFDEPTAPLTKNEVEILFRIIRTMKEQGIAIIYISHRLEEVFELCDTLTVLRDGEKIITLPVSQTDRKQLIRYMINLDLDEGFPVRRKNRGKDLLLEVRNLCGKGFEDINFQLWRGEILGLAGLVGSKRTEIARAIFGADGLENGSILFNGKPVVINSPSQAIRKGIALVPEDRKTEGIISKLSIRWNLTLAILKNISGILVINRQKENSIVQKYRDLFSIKMADDNLTVTSLSGGNQQKVVISKWLASNPELIILDEPTRGIDVSTKQDIYEFIIEMADNGIGVILISSDMDEMIGLSDRLLVLYEGKSMGILERGKFNKQELLEMESGYVQEIRV